MEVKQANKSLHKTGTSGATYTEVARLDTRGCGQQGKTLVLIKNTGASWDLHYKVDGYPADPDGTLSGLSIAVKAETALGEGATTAATDIPVDKGYAAVVVSVKNAESTPTTWMIDLTTY